MFETPIHKVSDEWAQRAYVDDAKYQSMYAESVSDPEALTTLVPTQWRSPSSFAEVFRFWLFICPQSFPVL